MPAKGAPLTALQATEVTYRYGGRAVFEPLTLSVAAGEMLAIVGPSGCGKSTLLEVLSGLRAPAAGTVAGARAVLMPQHDALLDWLDAAGNAALPLRLRGLAAPAARAVAAERLAALGLAEAAERRPYELSGGMRQRVAFARTLLSEAPVLCLDEPFGALDAITRAHAQRWLATALAGEAAAVVLVTHAVEEAALLAGRILVLSPAPGRVVAEIPGPARPPAERSATDPDVVAVRRQVLAALEGAAA